MNFIQAAGLYQDVYQLEAHITYKITYAIPILLLITFVRQQFVLGINCLIFLY